MAVKKSTKFPGFAIYLFLQDGTFQAVKSDRYVKVKGV